jgi:hypothetical protein
VRHRVGGCLRRWVFRAASARMAVAAVRVGRRKRRGVHVMWLTFSLIMCMPFKPLLSSFVV